ncbi:MAG TPA: SH3 domain-containing protein [Chloroflexota bacterium]|nr:SH3 domain-containing protein [Chloroflexota bacterium]
MSWTPRHGHVSQLHPGPGGALSGWNDCWEACLARYLRERGAPVIEGDDWVLIDAVSRAARGAADSPGNGDTSLGEAERSLAAFGITPQWTDSYQEALLTPWAICLVDGRALVPAQYPAEWFGDETPGPNHFVLWLPRWQGNPDWFNDPLAYANRQEDCRYHLGSVAVAFAGAYLLPPTGNGEIAPPIFRVTARCALKLQPNHTCLAMATLPSGAVVTALAGTQGGWRQVRTTGGLSGWAPSNRLIAEAA